MTIVKKTLSFIGWTIVGCVLLGSVITALGIYAMS